MTNLGPSTDCESGRGGTCKAGVQEEKHPSQLTRCPVENSDDEWPQTSVREQKLASDVEEDGCPLTPRGATYVNEKPLLELTHQLTELSLDKKTVAGPSCDSTVSHKMGIPLTADQSSDLSCDKAAKDLSNLLESLTVNEDKPKGPAVSKNAGLASMLRKIDEQLADLRLRPTSSNSHELKGRGLGDGDWTSSYAWDQWGELDLQPAADLANYFSRQSGDMFGNPPSTDHYGLSYTSSTYPCAWNSSESGFSSPAPDSNFASSPSAGVNLRLSKLLESTTGPPSANYQRPSAGFIDRAINGTSYSDLLASPLANGQLPALSTVSSPKRTKYMYADGQKGTGAASLYPTADTKPLPVASAHPLGYHIAPSTLYCSPPHRLSPTEATANYASSGYGGDFPLSSPGSVLSAGTLPNSPDSSCHGPGSDSDLGYISPQSSPRNLSPSSLSPQHSPSDSGLSSAVSPYSQQHSVSPTNHPYSPAEPPRVTIAVDSLSPPSVPHPPAPTSTDCTLAGHHFSPPTTGHEDRGRPTGYPAQGTLSQTQHVTQLVRDSGDLLFGYTDDDGDSFLHILTLVYENVLVSRGDKSASSFLHYISQTLLAHSLVKEKLNQQNNMLQTPLYVAVQRKLLPVVGLLVKLGANVNIQGRCEKLAPMQRKLESPLHVAARFGDVGLPLVQTLLEANSTNINIQDTHGETPLHVAVREHDSLYVDSDGTCRSKTCWKLVLLLLKHGADIDIKDYKSGRTPIMVAIETKDVSLVRAMLDCCDPRSIHELLNDVTYDMNTCMHLAFGLQGMEEAKHVELVRMLMKRGGEADSENSINLKAKDMAPKVFKTAVKIWR